MSDPIATKWAVYEANVQQYRILSATVQSFLLAVGSIWFSASSGPQAVRSPLFLGLLLVAGLFHIFYVWIPVVVARVRIVDYYKGQVDLPEERRRELQAKCSEDAYRSNAELRYAIASEYFDESLKQPMRRTRVKLDIVVPLIYAVVWCAIALATLLK